MKINIPAVCSFLVAVYYFLKKWIGELSKIVEPLIVEVEKMAQDGRIDKADRKALVMKAIALLEKQGTIKLNFLSRLIVSKVVDKIAGKLPDYNINISAQEVLSQANLQK